MPDRLLAAPDAPAPIGPYALAVRDGHLLFLSGQTPIDPATGRLVDGDVGAQTRRALANLGAVLAAAGATWAHVLKTTVFLTDMAAFAEMNAAYADVLGASPPARTTIAVRGLPLGAAVEIELVASLAGTGA